MGNLLRKQRRSNSDEISSSHRSRRVALRGFSRSSMSEASPPPPVTAPRGSRTLSGSNRSEASPSVTPGSQPPPSAKTSTNKYAYIPDNFKTLEQVTAALRESGLESSNLIVGIDFTKSNEWTGKHSFNNRSLHAIGNTPNPYEQAISIIGKTLAPFDEDNLIPCYGFGDATTHDQEVFSFHSDHTPCHGFEEVLTCYKQIVPNLRLSGPTSFGPVVEAAIDIVEKSGGQFHVLVIIADGQVTRSVDTKEGARSPQEESTINSICTASSYALAIVLVGVGDGPWDEMKRFDDQLPARKFDNFQFVNFTDIMSKNVSPSEKETAFALAALMEIPIQYKATMELGIHGHKTGRAKKIVPRPPPVPYMRRQQPDREPSNPPPVVSSGSEPNQVCPICLTNEKNLAFGCGHLTCRDCGQSLSNCPICRAPITSRLRVYPG
ncbi:E3 ubiquitin-protein ligase RGLG4 [Macadamia integrifolia]|uniref:E3 ubiquitin-protein ligase RGLG4 n=1 Tax=Macadamia integrifolia TaxID=60698 RepID=UPI001C53244E|nr:E3 ubiquitin-protein ligase RGLG4 [Macadamia integrifolia]